MLSALTRSLYCASWRNLESAPSFHGGSLASSSPLMALRAVCPSPPRQEPNSPDARVANLFLPQAEGPSSGAWRSRARPHPGRAPSQPTRRGGSVAPFVTTSSTTATRDGRASTASTAKGLKMGLCCRPLPGAAYADFLTGMIRRTQEPLPCRGLCARAPQRCGAPAKSAPETSGVLLGAGTNITSAPRTSSGGVVRKRRRAPQQLVRFREAGH